MTIGCYLVIDPAGRKPSVVRSTQRKPFLEAGQAAIRIELDLPPAVFEHPVATITVPAEQVVVAVEARLPEGSMQ